MVPLSLSQEILMPTMAPVSSFSAWRDQVRTLAQVPTYRHGTSPVYVPGILQCARFVFIHCDSQCTPRQGNYDGPFVVIKSGPVTFKIDIGSSQRTSLLSG